MGKKELAMAADLMARALGDARHAHTIALLGLRDAAKPEKVLEYIQAAAEAFDRALTAQSGYTALCIQRDAAKQD